MKQRGLRDNEEGPDRGVILASETVLPTPHWTQVGCLRCVQASVQLIEGMKKSLWDTRMWNEREVGQTQACSTSSFV